MTNQKIISSALLFFAIVCSPNLARADCKDLEEFEVMAAAEPGPKYVDPMLETLIKADDKTANFLGQIYKSNAKSVLNDVRDSLKGAKAYLPGNKDATCYMMSTVEQKLLKLSESINALRRLNHPGERCFTFTTDDLAVGGEEVFPQLCGALYGRNMTFQGNKRGNQSDIKKALSDVEKSLDRADAALDIYKIRGLQ